MANLLQVSPGAIALWENRQRSMPGPVPLLIDLFEAELSSMPLPEVFLNPPLKTGMRRAYHLAKPFFLARLKKGRQSRAVFGPDEQVRKVGPSVAAQVAIARQVAQSLNEAKGLPVKIAQIMGYFDFHIPYAVREVFASLRNEGMPINPLIVAKIIQEDLGSPPSRLFAEWEAKPFAAASIGQVHRARLRSGERVAVKVQYPGIQDTIQSDLRSISILGKLAHLILRGPDHSTIIQEIKEHLLQECDYGLEASHQEQFLEIFKGHPIIVIPKVHREFCSKRVLVTTYFEGQTFEEFCTTADQLSRNRVGEAIWDYFNLPKYKYGFFNCDPHSGNFIVTQGKIVCLDFGAVKKMADTYRIHQKQQSLSILREDPDGLLKAIQGMGIIRDPKAFNFEAHYHFLMLVARPYRLSQPFQFSENYRQTLWQAMQTNPNQNATHLPPEEVMAVRCHFGELAALTLLQAEAKWRDKMLSVIC
jgi:predicted unusual protein kinase regulating ubiquinone biosynthesis (AarF/ABC1/UbiB family)